MRIIAGSARGLRIEAPPGPNVRPTLDRVREALFSILMPRLEDARFVDLFCGSGANGIEALSRGAANVTFVDQDRKALNTVRDNLNRARVATHATCLQLEIPREIQRIPGTFDLVFADPAYDFDAYDALLDAIAAGTLLAEDGLVIVEHRRSVDLPATTDALTRTRVAPYGQCALSFYAR